MQIALFVEVSYTTQTALTIIAFFRILVLYPEVQKRAQKEIDTVTGGLRLPDYADRPRLPYVDALCREVMRWSMATPVGWWRCPLADDNAKLM